jgi:hypothetical protein
VGVWGCGGVGLWVGCGMMPRSPSAPSVSGTPAPHTHATAGIPSLAPPTRPPRSDIEAGGHFASGVFSRAEVESVLSRLGGGGASGAGAPRRAARGADDASVPLPPDDGVADVRSVDGGDAPPSPFFDAPLAGSLAAATQSAPAGGRGAPRGGRAGSPAPARVPGSDARPRRDA